MNVLSTHLCNRLFANADVNDRVFIQDNTLYEHPLLTIDYTTYDLKRDADPIHLNFGNQAVLVYSPISQDTEPWLYAYVIAIYHVFVYTVAEPQPKRLEFLWVRWMERNQGQLKGPNSSQHSRISFVQHSGVSGEAFGLVDPSHVIRACHLIPAYHLGRTCERLGPSIARDVKGDWQAFYANRYVLFYVCMSQPPPLSHGTHRFVNRDAFARFSGIGIGCQMLQATRSLELTIGPDAPDPPEPAAGEFDESLFAGCYTMDDEDGGDP